MITAEDTDSMKCFEIQASIPGKSYVENWQFAVVTVSLQKAVEMVLAEQPKANIWQVTHRGSYSRKRVLVDPAAK